jgi:hypothetical protein
LEALKRQNNGIPIGSSAPIRIALCAARRRLRRPRKRPRRPWRLTGSQRRSRVRSSVQTCLQARPHGLQRRVHPASRSSRRTTSTVRSAGWRTRVLSRCLVGRLDSPPQATPPCLGGCVWLFVCLFICVFSRLSTAASLWLLGVCLFVLAERVPTLPQWWLGLAWLGVQSSWAASSCPSSPRETSSARWSRRRAYEPRTTARVL